MSTIIGKPLTGPADEQVRMESEVLEKILPADRHEYLMDYALRLGVSPFKALDIILFRGMTSIISDSVKARCGLAWLEKKVRGKP